LRTVEAFARNTRRGYANDWSSFVECCRQHGFHPLPATSSAVQTFNEWRSPERPDLVAQGLYRYVKPGMSRQPIAAIGAVHRALKYPDPTIDEDVRATLKTNVAGRQVQSHKGPLRWADLGRAFAKMGEDLHALRDKALAAVGHSTASAAVNSWRSRSKTTCANRGATLLSWPCARPKPTIRGS
jgi:hypothetical protein